MAAAAMEPTDTQRVTAMPRANAAISMKKPTGPNTNHRQAAATAMPLPPLNLSQGLKMWPSVQPAKATAKARPTGFKAGLPKMPRSSWPSGVTASTGTAAMAGANTKAASQPDKSPFPKSSTNTSAPPTFPMARKALVVPMLPDPSSRMSLWKASFETMTPQGMEPSRNETTNDRVK